MCKRTGEGVLLGAMVAAEGATWVDIEINVASLVSIWSQDVWTCRRGWNARRWMQELCLKNCDQDVAGQKLENLSKGGMVWEQTLYRKGFLPCCMLAASAAKAPRLAIPLASSNELTNDRGSSPHYCPGTAARVTVIPVTQVGVQGSQTGYTPRKQQRTHQDECPSRFELWGQHYMALPAQLHAYWNRMNVGSCGEAPAGWTLGGHGGTRYKTKWMQESVFLSLLPFWVFPCWYACRF